MQFAVGWPCLKQGDWTRWSTHPFQPYAFCDSVIIDRKQCLFDGVFVFELNGLYPVAINILFDN